MNEEFIQQTKGVLETLLQRLDPKSSPLAATSLLAIIMVATEGLTSIPFNEREIDVYTE